MSERNSGWRNWGDHPIVVLIGLAAAVVSIVAFLTVKENKLVNPGDEPTKSNNSLPSPEKETQSVLNSRTIRDPVSITPSPGTSHATSPSPTASPNPSLTVRERAVHTPTVPSTIINDVGKTKVNEFYEMTLENAWVSTGQIRSDICSFNVPSGFKAILVRFALKRSPSRTLSGQEFMRVGSVQSSDFVVVDDQNKRADTACQKVGFVIGQNAIPRTLEYLVPAGSQHLSFRFQKSGVGEAIVFDLSDL